MTEITIFDTVVTIGQRFQVFNPVSEMGNDLRLGTFHFDANFSLIPDDETGETHLDMVKRYIQNYTGDEYECPYIEEVQPGICKWFSHGHVKSSMTTISLQLTCYSSFLFGKV